MVDPHAPDFQNTPGSPQRPTFGYAPSDAHAPPAVTIVTPFYNTGPIFHETARSVLGQSLQQWEWLIVNDGSDDPQALAVLDEYRQRDPRIRVVDLGQNRGLPAARNAGFSQARAPYVLQLDSDDLIEPTAAEVWAWFLESHPEAAFVTGYTVGFGAEQYLWTDGFHNPGAFLSRNPVSPTAMVRVSAFRAAGGYDEQRRGGLEDWDFWLRCAASGLWGDTVPLYLDWYRRRETHGDRWEALRGDGIRRFAAEARQRYPRLWREGMPHLQYTHADPAAPVPAEPSFANLLAAPRPRLLIALPQFGEPQRPVLELTRALAGQGFEITVAATTGSDVTLLPAFAQVTPDVFVLPAFLRPQDRPRFLAYLARSRRAEGLIVAGSVFDALLIPWIRARLPGVAVLAYAYEEGGQSAGSASLHAALGMLSQIDLTLSAGPALRARAVERGAEQARVAACGPDGDPAHLVRRAQELARSQPRPILEPGLADYLALCAVEYHRARAEGERLEARLAALARREPAAIALLRRAYYWGLDHGMGWLRPARDRLRRYLVRRP